MTPVLEAEGLGYAVDGSTLLQDVDLEVQRGELVAIAGPNGAGKSTLLRLLAGDLAPTAGEARLEGRPCRSYAPRDLARLRAVLPQQTVLQFAFTAEEVVEFGRAPHRGRFSGSIARERSVIRAAMKEADVLTFAARSFPTLSAGEQSRVSLARVLAQETPVLLLDEPTAALDIRHQEHVMGVARRLSREGRTIVAVVHDLNLAARYADSVALLCGGSLVASGSPWDVLTGGTLTDVFDHPVQVVPHPGGDRPLVLAEPAWPSSSP
ncbi:MAG TPA: heme ABC transporter ATP-binding protein [Gaiellaceae bacterium]|jgi:iron complex transport system ATP-binding protein